MWFVEFMSELMLSAFPDLRNFSLLATGYIIRGYTGANKTQNVDSVKA